MSYPRFSLRFILYAFTICSVIFIFLGQAVRGELWARAICLSIVAFFAHFIFHTLFYGMNRLLSHWVGTMELPARTNQGGLQSRTDSFLALESKNSQSDEQ